VYWIVDIDAQTVDVWMPESREARTERETLVWHPVGASAPFALAITELFRAV